MKNLKIINGAKKSIIREYNEVVTCINGKINNRAYRLTQINYIDHSQYMIEAIHVVNKQAIFFAKLNDKNLNIEFLENELLELYGDN